LDNAGPIRQHLTYPHSRPLFLAVSVFISLVAIVDPLVQCAAHLPLDNNTDRIRSDFISDSNDQYRPLEPLNVR